MWKNVLSASYQGIEEGCLRHSTHVDNTQVVANDGLPLPFPAMCIIFLTGLRSAEIAMNEITPHLKDIKTML
jgi:hypothetical protein